MARRLPPGYRVKKVYMVQCARCNAEISRPMTGEDIETYEEAVQAAIDDHAVHERDDQISSTEGSDLL